jgi:DNA polymerase bacteriophage-type
VRTLAIDIETYSSNDLKKGGVYKYVEAPDFQILLLAYRFNDEEVELVDLAAGKELPFDVQESLTNTFVKKTAFNALFERTCIARHFGLRLPPSQWECTMAKSFQLGLSGNLDLVAKSLKLSVTKDPAGKALIRFFTMPCKPTKSNEGRTRNLAIHAREKWEDFKKYCIKDVEVESEIRKAIAWFDVPATEKSLWALDQRINDAGVLIDPVLVKNAIQFDLAFAEKLSDEAAELTGLHNPNSVKQLKEWMLQETGEEVDKLNKDTVPALIEKTSDETVRRVLELRQQMSKTSVKKYIAMKSAFCSDRRIRGLFQYCGAGRTWRWAGRIVQPQNLPKNNMADLDLARQLVLDGDMDLLEICFGNVPATLSQLIRTAFIAPKGSRLMAADFSAIEARVIAWLATEQWRLDVFNSHGKIYEASGAHMFKVSIDQVKKGSVLRDKAKIAELALGYQGGVNALLKMGAIKMGLKESELPDLVAKWRDANKKIVSFWQECGRAAIEAVEKGCKVKIKCGITFHVERDILFVELHSGRKLAYQHPRLVDGKFGGYALTYHGTDQQKKVFGRQTTYGGKIVENIVQAEARDLLAEAMIRLDKAGYFIVMHVHDEVVMQMPNGQGSLAEINRIMGQPIPWAKGLPLQADSYETPYYKKED